MKFHTSAMQILKKFDPRKSVIVDKVSARLGELVVKRPLWVIAATLLLVAGAGSGIRHLDFSNNYRVFFSKDNPDLIAFEEFQSTYTKNDNILFVVQPKEGTAFTPEVMGGIEELTAEAWRIPYAIRVDSPTNFQHSRAVGDDLFVDDLIRDGTALSESELADRKNIALLEPLLRDRLVSGDARTIGVNVTLQYPEKSIKEVPEAVGVARALAAEFESNHPDARVAISGLSMLNNSFAEAGQIDAVTLVPLMFGVLVLFMLIVLRSAWGTASVVAVIAFSTATALGIAGYFGIMLSPFSAMSPVIILTLAIADGIHVLITFLGRMREGDPKEQALRESIRVNFLPVLITSITTIIGFLSLLFSDAPPFRHLGIITSIGIAAALVYSLLFLPALLQLAPVRVRVRPRSGAPAGGTVYGRMADWITAHYRPVLLVMGVVTIGLIAMVPRIELNDEFVKYFDYRVPFRSDAEFAADNLSGVYVIEFSMESGEPGGISEPEYLVSLASFTNWLREQSEVMHVTSYVDVIKRLNKNMHGDDESYYRLPEDRELAAQFLLLYELSLPYGLDLNDRINIDKSATRVSATLHDMSTAEIRTFLARTRNWLERNSPESMNAEPTGAAMMFAYISQRNIESMLGGNLMAILLIAVVMMLALGSLRLGALSLIPNAAPILMSFGVWGLLVRQVGMAAATVSATSLAIVVDDTVHFLTKYLRARRERNLDARGAVRYAFETVGPALVSTTAILAFGFAVLAFSSFRINAQMGLLTALAIVIALAADFLLLPALLMFGDSLRKRKEPAMTNQYWKPIAAASALLLMFFLPTILRAEPADGKGYEIAARSDRSDRGFGDSLVDLKMVLRNATGKESTRTLSIRTLEMPDESIGDKSLIVFDSPADIDGTGLLSHAKILDPDNQWLYLPALKRVKRISSVNKSGPFVGSEFAFEDFTALELNKFSYTYLRAEPCGTHRCDVLERTPLYEHSGYSKQYAWIDQTDYQLRKVEFYDRRGDLLKTLELGEYRLYAEKFWRAQRLSMVNHQTGKSTELVFSEFEFGRGLHETDFVRGALLRIH